MAGHNLIIGTSETTKLLGVYNMAAHICLTNALSCRPGYKRG